jgi:hypothetical protein
MSPELIGTHNGSAGPGGTSFSRQVVGDGDAGGQRRAVGEVEEGDDRDRVVDLGV